jgi:hypothetical protein
MFLEALVIIPVYKGKPNDYDFDCYPITNLNSPMIQRQLEHLDTYDYLKIANLGLLMVKEVAYGKGGRISITCRKVHEYAKSSV